MTPAEDRTAAIAILREKFETFLDIESRFTAEDAAYLYSFAARLHLDNLLAAARMKLEKKPEKANPLDTAEISR